MPSKSQISMEYVLIIGFSLFIITVLLVIAQSYSSEVNEQVITNQIDRLAKEIVNNAESLYYFGEPSSITIRTYLPPNVKDIDIIGKEITFVVRTRQGDTDMSYPSKVNLDGNISISYGYKDITITAKEGYVWINESV